MCSQIYPTVDEQDVSGLLETAKKHYSHGLEAIYSFESIDPKSIRKLTPVLQEEKQAKIIEEIQSQWTFDLGDSFNGWMESFILQEPISQLDLSPHLEVLLKEKGAICLQDAMKLEGLLHGYQLELQERLGSYLGKRSLYRCKKVNFASILRRFLSELSPSLAKDLSDHFELGSFFKGGRTLGFGFQKKEKNLLLEALHKEFKSTFLQDSLEQIRMVYLYPWVRDRQGIASKEEIQERWCRVAFDLTIDTKVFEFFDELLPSKWQLEGFNKLDTKTYSREPSEPFFYVRDLAMSYFYQSDLWYPLSDLSARIEREAAKSWISFREGYIEKVLTLSDSFCIYKGSSGGKEIRLRHKALDLEPLPG